MADLGLGNVNVNDLPDGGNFEPLPAGWYRVKIKEAPVNSTSAGTGLKLEPVYEVEGGEKDGRTIMYADCINIKNPNPKAEEIARQSLKNICRSVGIANIQDSDQLVGTTLEIKLVVEKSAEYGDRNKVKGYRAVSGSSAPSGPVGGPAQAPKTKPWG